MGKVIITVNDFFYVYDGIKELVEQNIKFPINVALKLMGLYDDLFKINSYILNRIENVLPSITNPSHVLSDDEEILYNSILTSPIEIDMHGLTKEDILGCEKINIGIKAIGKLVSIL